LQSVPAVQLPGAEKSTFQRGDETREKTGFAGGAGGAGCGLLAVGATAPLDGGAAGVTGAGGSTRGGTDTEADADGAPLDGGAGAEAGAPGAEGTEVAAAVALAGASDVARPGSSLWQATASRARTNTERFTIDSP
jgi:hypothetical protein